jgi:hypothetical protein
VNRIRAFGVGQGALGVALLSCPSVIATWTAKGTSAPPTWLVRVLGARLLGQGCWLTAHPSNDVLALGRFVDTIHGSTMLIAAAAKPSYRRSAVSAAGAASVSIVISLAVRG